jgi:hypothetical protein
MIFSPPLIIQQSQWRITLPDCLAGFPELQHGFQERVRREEGSAVYRQCSLAGRQLIHHGQAKGLAKRLDRLRLPIGWK